MEEPKQSNFEDAIKGSFVSRRWLLKHSANITAGTVAISAFGVGTKLPEAQPLPACVHAEVPHCDLATGEIFDRERHHRWDTV
jgi:hypothetical protein